MSDHNTTHRIIRSIPLNQIWILVLSIFWIVPVVCNPLIDALFPTLFGSDLLHIISRVLQRFLQIN